MLRGWPDEWFNARYRLPVLVRVAVPTELTQRLLRQVRREARRRQRLEMHAWLARGDPLRQQLTERGSDGQAADAAAAQHIQSLNARNRPHDVLAIHSH